MAINSYKKGTLIYRKNIMVNRTALYDIYDGDKCVGKLTLSMDFAMNEDKKMGETGRVSNPKPEQMLERLVLDVPRASFDRKTNRFKR